MTRILSFNGELSKIISGGQTGADRAGIDAARECGLETGGWAPANYRTQNGNDFSLRDLNLIEDSSAAYPPRTEKNVRDSDGTLLIGLNLQSPGSVLTQRYIAKHRKPSFLVQLELDNVNHLDQIDAAIRWLKNSDIRVLNIAGNREKTFGGKSLVYRPTYDFVVRLIKQSRVNA